METIYSKYDTISDFFSIKDNNKTKKKIKGKYIGKKQNRMDFKTLMLLLDFNDIYIYRCIYNNNNDMEMLTNIYVY